MKILLSHGDGGSLTQQLIEDVFLTAFDESPLHEQEDAAILPAHADDLVISTDSFVIHPLAFPGGDIGKLAVAGTVNDLAVSGAEPAYLSVGFILEEGLEIAVLKRIVASMAKTAKEAGVRIVTGDTKVVEKGKGDQVYINTTGIGFQRQRERLGFAAIQPGDQIVINGGIAEHAVAVLSERSGATFQSPVASDCRSLNHLIKQVLERFETVRFMRDPTRGGIATTLQEIASQAGVNIWLQEEQIPIRPEVAGAVELLGMDPYYLANEGKVLFIVSEQEAEQLTMFLRQFPENQQAAVIGHIESGGGDVILRTAMGGRRKLHLMSGAPLPRIC